MQLFTRAFIYSMEKNFKANIQKKYIYTQWFLEKDIKDSRNKQQKQFNQIVSKMEWFMDKIAYIHCIPFIWIRTEYSLLFGCCATRGIFLITMHSWVYIYYTSLCTKKKNSKKRSHFESIWYKFVKVLLDRHWVDRWRMAWWRWR